MLELKFGIKGILPSALAAFNRTMLELKFGEGEVVGVYQVSFNRTMLELKCFPALVSTFTPKLLIVPCWN